jgi:hypothetical protein
MVSLSFLLFSQPRLWPVQFPPYGRLCGRRHGQTEPTPVPDPLSECPFCPPWPLGHRWIRQLQPAPHRSQPHHHETRKTGLFCPRKQKVGQGQELGLRLRDFPPDDPKVGRETQETKLRDSWTSSVCIVSWEIKQPGEAQHHISPGDAACETPLRHIDLCQSQHTSSLPQLWVPKGHEHLRSFLCLFICDK